MEPDIQRTFLCLWWQCCTPVLLTFCLNHVSLKTTMQSCVAVLSKTLLHVPRVPIPVSYTRMAASSRQQTENSATVQCVLLCWRLASQQEPARVVGRATAGLSSLIFLCTNSLKRSSRSCCVRGTGCLQPPVAWVAVSPTPLPKLLGCGGSTGSWKGFRYRESRAIVRDTAAAISPITRCCAQYGEIEVWISREIS